MSTDKVDTEIPSPVAGTLLEITAAEDETVDVGGQLGADRRRGRGIRGGPARRGADPRPPTRARAEAHGSTCRGVDRSGARRRGAPRRGAARRACGRAARVDGQRRGAPYVTPLVRKLATEHAVDLSTVTGSGVGGRIRKQDVLAAAEAARPAPEPEPEPEPAAPAAAAESAPTTPAPPAAPAAPTPAARPAAGGPQPGTTVKLPRLRQVIAQRMTESLRVSAQLTTVQEVDLTRIAKLRARVKDEFERREGIKLTFLPFFAKATVEALKQFPAVNASINDEAKEVTYHGDVHLAIAVDTPRGLLVPVIKNAEDLNIAGLAKRIADVAARTRDGKIGPDELSGGTFTITNIGSAGALFDTPIINQPQVGDPGHRRDHPEAAGGRRARTATP